MRNTRPSTPLDDRMQSAVLGVWDDYGGRLRRAIVARFPALGVCANRILGPDGFESACLRGLVIAASKFDPERGVKLMTYALQRMRCEVQDDLARCGAMTKRGEFLPVVAAVIEAEDGTEKQLHELEAVAPGDRLELADTRRAVRRQVGDLDPRLRQVVMGRYFFGLSLHEMAGRMGVTRERVRQLEVQALNHLRRRLREEHA